MEEINKEVSEHEENFVDENEVEEIVEDTEEEKPKKKKRKEKKLEETIGELQESLSNMQNDYYKAYADTENLKKRLQNDAEMLRKYRIQSFAQDILPAIDNLERAINFESEDEEVKNYVDGIKMVYQQLKTSLDKEGVNGIDCLNQKFDPNIHQALLTEKVEGVEEGIVVEEIQKGYMLKDRVLRASLVKVSE